MGIFGIVAVSLADVVLAIFLSDDRDEDFGGTNINGR